MANHQARSITHVVKKINVLHTSCEPGPKQLVAGLDEGFLLREVRLCTLACSSCWSIRVIII